MDGEGHRRAVRGLIQQVITADAEVISIEKVNEAYERMVKSDVKYRFSIDMASLKSE